MGKTIETEKAYAHIRIAIPELRPIITLVGEVPLPIAQAGPVTDALVKIIAGQMLSRSAASAIVARVKMKADQIGCHALHDLSSDELRLCGLSARKARTIGLIADEARSNEKRFEGWRALPFNELRCEVSSLWGLSDWSAAMLAIFHFGQRDVFPTTDGSLLRACHHIETNPIMGGASLDHEAAAPYRTYLSMLLWTALDDGHLKFEKT